MDLQLTKDEQRDDARNNGFFLLRVDKETGKFYLLVSDFFVGMEYTACFDTELDLYKHAGVVLHRCGGDHRLISALYGHYPDGVSVTPRIDRVLYANWLQENGTPLSLNEKVQKIRDGMVESIQQAKEE